MAATSRELSCHALTSCTDSIVLRASVSGSTAMRLGVEFRLDGDLDRLSIAAAARPERAERLWEHTCFEVFVATPGDASYLEWNLAPSGRWAAYAFRAYREREEDREAPATAPEIDVERRGDGVVLRAQLPLGWWLAARRPTDLELGLSAVIETVTGKLSYWAIRHRADRPDFHDRTTFDLVLQPH